MSELRDKIEAESKNTIGYSEAANKESFMVGVSVGFHRTNDFYSQKISALESQLEMVKASYAQVRTDMYTLVNIINKYSDND